MAVTLIPHTTYEWTDLTMTAGEQSGTLVVTCDAGYQFDGVITLHSNSSGTDYPATSQTDTVVRFEQKYVNRDWVVQGSVIADGGSTGEFPANFVMQIEHVHDNGSAFADGVWNVALKCDEGWRFTEAPKVEYRNEYGQLGQVTLQLSEDSTEATKTISGVSEDTQLTFTGTTTGQQPEPEPELNVTNEIDRTTEQHTYDGVTATFTVTSENSPNWRFIDPKVNYTGTDGQPKSVDMSVEVLQYNSVATATVTDIDPEKPVTITGEFKSVTHIYSDLSNCAVTEPLPEWLETGETLNVTLQANPNTEFDTQPYFKISAAVSSRVPLTVSEDKKTATGSLLIADYSSVTVVGDAVPVSVVGQQYGAINVYLVTLDELAEFSAKRFFKVTGTDPGTGAPQYENVDLGEYVNRIRRIYTNIAASSTDVIRCGNYNTGVECQQPAQDKITLDFGTAVVPAHNEDNTDFESELQIFLPFAGFVSLPVDYAGKTISLQYVINVVTGNGVALLSCNGVVFQVEEIEPSSEIIYLSPSTQVKTVGGDDWNEMLYYGVEPYIYCKWFASKSAGRNNERKTGEIGDFRGFNIFDDVEPIHTPEMLAEEQEMIYTALSDGVYIE